MSERFELATGDQVIDAFDCVVDFCLGAIGRIRFLPRTTPTPPECGDIRHDPALVSSCRDALVRWCEGDIAAIRALPWRRPDRAFTARVYSILVALPPGHTLSYHELAARAGNGRAVRAAASACARNPIPLLVPCHAVLPQAAQRCLCHNPDALWSPRCEVGAYAYGSDLKRALLRHERAHRSAP